MVNLLYENTDYSLVISMIGFVRERYLVKGNKSNIIGYQVGDIIWNIISLLYSVVSLECHKQKIKRKKNMK